MKVFILAAALIAMLALDGLEAQAQGMGRRDRGGGASRDTQSRDTPRATPVAASDPFSALERELPSLAVDLRLSAEQVSPWSAFERDVRDVAEMTRSQRRHMLALREGGEKPPTAVSLVATLAEDQRIKAEATRELQHHLEALYARLDDAQKLTLDRRVVLSQTEPLGR
jgi:LTXXQ motif family protein